MQSRRLREVLCRVAVHDACSSPPPPPSSPPDLGQPPAVVNSCVTTERVDKLPYLGILFLAGQFDLTPLSVNWSAPLTGRQLFAGANAQHSSPLIWKKHVLTFLRNTRGRSQSRRNSFLHSYRFFLTEFDVSRENPSPWTWSSITHQRYRLVFT